MKKIVAVGLFGLTLFAGGCAARTGPIRGESSVGGDSTSVSGRGQVNKDTQTADENQKKSSSGGGAVSGSATGGGTGSVSGSGRVESGS